MLGSVRKQTKSWTGKAIIILLAGSFAVWGINDVFRGPGAGTAVTVGKIEVSIQTFDTEFRRDLRRLQARSPDITYEQAHQLGVTSQVLSRLVGEALIDQEAEDLGLRVADLQVREAILEQSSFLTEGNQFDRELYTRVLAQNRLTEAAYENMIRTDLKRQQLLQTIQWPRPAPRALADQLLRFRDEKRSADIAFIARSSSSAPAQPTETELEALHQEQAASFTSPERRTVTYIHLTAEAIMSEMEISDEDVRAEYEVRAGEFDLPEQRAIRQLLANDEALIREGAEMLSAGKSFDEVSDALVSRGATALDLPAVEEQGLPRSAADVVFSLAEGETSGTVQTPLGWHIFLLTEIRPPSIKEFEQVADELRQDIGLDAAIESLFRLSTVVEDELAGGATLEQAAAAIDLNTIKLEGIDVQGRNAAGTAQIENLAEREEVVDVAFETEEGLESDLIELADGSYLLLRVDEVTPPALQPLEEVRTQVIAFWQRDAEINAAGQAAKRLAERVKAGEPLMDAASAEGYETFKASGLLRDGQNAGPRVSASLVDGIFAQNPATPAPVVARAGGGWAVAVLTDVKNDTGTNTDALRRMASEIGQGRAADVATVFRRLLTTRHPVEINGDAIDRLFAAQ